MKMGEGNPVPMIPDSAVHDGGSQSIAAVL